MLVHSGSYISQNMTIKSDGNRAKTRESEQQQRSDFNKYVSHTFPSASGKSEKKEEKLVLTSIPFSHAIFYLGVQMFAVPSAMVFFFSFHFVFTLLVHHNAHPILISAWIWDYFNTCMLYGECWTRNGFDHKIKIRMCLSVWCSVSFGSHATNVYINRHRHCIDWGCS